MLSQFTKWMWFDYYKGDIDDIIKIITGISSNVTNNVVGIVFHAITPVVPSLTENILLGQLRSDVAGHRINYTSFTKEIGTIYVPAWTGTYIDYNTDITIYLPYCGFYSLNPKLIIGKNIRLRYVVDITNGECVAEVWTNDRLCYSFSGNEGTHMPFSVIDGTEFLAKGVELTGKLLASTNPVGAALTLASGVTAQPPSANTSSISASGSIYQYQPQKPFIVCVRNKLDGIGNSFNRTYGRVCKKSLSLANLTGLTIVNNPRFDVWYDDARFTKEEKEILYQNMKEGVIL